MEHTITAYGASIRGPSHLSAGTPNEDAWTRADNKSGSLIVVCDGLGSKPHSRLGAMTACAAVREAVTRWARVQGAPTSYLAYLIEVFWRLRLHPSIPKEAATTCLLAFARNTGDWIVGGIGDGLALVRTGLEPAVVVIGGQRDGFSNETTGLGLSTGSRAWRLETFPASVQMRLAVLATDGVADDLVDEFIDGFCDWLGALEHLTPAVRWRRLASELRAWPTPKHLDDKTIAVMKSYNNGMKANDESQD